MDSQRLAQYVIETRIAGGGMGDVWKAHDSKLQRPVAIKILKDQTPDAAARILAEARAASALNHPNICTIYETTLSRRRQARHRSDPGDPRDRRPLHLLFMVRACRRHLDHGCRRAAVGYRDADGLTRLATVVIP
jgi:serine/threonine protein kinase